jgi:hypothetical protein
VVLFAVVVLVRVVLDVFLVIVQDEVGFSRQEDDDDLAAAVVVIIAAWSLSSSSSSTRRSCASWSRWSFGVVRSSESTAGFAS